MNDEFIVSVSPHDGSAPVMMRARRLIGGSPHALLRCQALVKDGVGYRQCRSRAELDRVGFAVCRSHRSSNEVLVSAGV